MSDNGRNGGTPWQRLLRAFTRQPPGDGLTELERSLGMPTSGLDSERYKDKPLYVFLENYVLACIGALAQESEVRLTALVQRAWGGGEDWRATLRAKLELPDALDGRIRQMWVLNQNIAESKRMNLTPVQFARMFVETNFPLDPGGPTKADERRA